MSHLTHILLTGGVGSRLWPLSRQSRPKQYLDLFKGHSLFELSVMRNSNYADELIVVGNCENQHLSVEALEKLKLEDYKSIIEATPRNTAPAIAFAAFAAQAEDILLVTPADHIIEDGEEYKKAIGSAVQLAAENFLVTFGVHPTKPETGYGYIEFKEDTVLSFREKPDKETADKFLKTGNFLWNSGMFCFKAGIYLEELKKYSPEVYQRSLQAWEKAENGKLELETSLQIPAISVDYAVMEKSDKIKVVKADFEWSDMGSFEAVYDYLKTQGQAVDENGNMQIGSKKFTAFAGLQNCILVETEDANLVLAKEASQDVKQIYQELELNNPNLIN
ncbi:MAG: NTP transferase domain-containing protein [Flavobacteriaceae bacterium]|nr:NTP transferase domain-containing protein [Flavobacteriaceae bacterium]